MTSMYGANSKRQSGPSRLSSFVALTRLDRPVGYWLLFWPCAWGVILASPTLPNPLLLLLFLLGASCMRSAGCILNDLADRTIDAQVERTKTRPLASGALSVGDALALLVFLLALALLIVLALHPDLLLYAAASLMLVAAYPFMKRITWWPQAFLGITFNIGALFGWYAVVGFWDWPALALYICGIFWTIGYDTIYAHQDIEDDLRIGVKSTAIRFGKYNHIGIALCYLSSCSGLAIALYLMQAQWAWAALIVFVAHLFWQISIFKPKQPALALRLFKSNHIAGLCLALGLMLDHLLA